MCKFIHEPEAQSDQVSLEVKAAGGKLLAKVLPPTDSASAISFDDVPLLRAVKMAKLMADHLSTDVVIIDPLGIWHEWLVDWACETKSDRVPASAAAGISAAL
jgi:hypothetical protein